MPAYTLAQAAAACARNRSSILRAIKAGKLSAVRDEVTGEWRIEPAELHRLYPPADALERAQADASLRNGVAQTEIRELRARLADKDALIAAHQAEIADLRQQRDLAQAQIMALLTDQRAVPARRSWWRWWGSRSGP